MTEFEPDFPQQALLMLEATHRIRGGARLFCYVETRLAGTTYRLSIAREDEQGHYPIPEDFFMGSEVEMRAEAERLNRERLHLTPDHAAMIVASSMRGVR